MQINDSSRDYTPALWMLEFVQGPKRQYTSWPMYFTRGYHFHTYNHGQNKKTMNYGVCVRGTEESEFFGLIEEIFQIEYHGAVGLNAMIFKCSWFDQTTGRGMRRHISGIVDVCPSKQYQKYDPFILPEQTDQVCYIPYPRIRKSHEEWWASTKVLPRGYRDNTEGTQNALQDDNHNQVVVTSGIIQVNEHTVEEDSEDDLDDPPIIPEALDDDAIDDEDDDDLDLDVDVCDEESDSE